MSAPTHLNKKLNLNIMQKFVICLCLSAIVTAIICIIASLCDRTFNSVCVGTLLLLTTAYFFISVLVSTPTHQKKNKN